MWPKREQAKVRRDAIAPVLRQAGIERTVARVMSVRGRLYVSFADKPSRRVSVGAIAWKSYFGSIPDKVSVDHRDGNQLNFSKENLYLSTMYQKAGLPVPETADAEYKANVAAIRNLQSAIRDHELRPLSSAEIEQIKSEELPIDRLAKRLQISTTRLSRIRASLGLNKSRLDWSSDEIAVVSDESMSIGEIAACLGVCGRTIGKQRRKFGLNRYNVVTPEGYMTAAEAAERLKVTRNNLRQMIFQGKLKGVKRVGQVNMIPIIAVEFLESCR